MLQNPTSYDISDAASDNIATVNIVNNDSPITLAPITTNYNVPENVAGGNFVLEIGLNKAAKVNTVFKAELIASTATVNQDYREPNTSQLQIDRGARRLSYLIPILDDYEYEGNETFSIKFSSLIGAHFVNEVADITLVITIVDTESPILTFADQTHTANETDADASYQVNLNLSGSIETDIEISYEIIAETASSGVDFSDLSNGSVTILAQTTSIPINVQIKGDNISEGDETFKIKIDSVPDDVVFPLGTSIIEATVKIVDDEPILLSNTATSLNVAEDVEGGIFVFDLNFSSAVADTTSATQGISFNFALTDITTTKGNDYEDLVVSSQTVANTSQVSTLKIPILNDVDSGRK